MELIKSFFILVFFFTNTLAALSQSDVGYSIEGDRNREFNTEWMDKVFVGGNMGISFERNYAYINLSPNIGYQITEKMSLGTGISYIYTKVFDENFHDYGGNVFARYKILEQFFVTAQYETVSFNTGFEGERDIYSTVFVGGGMVQPIGENAYFVISALYNVLYDANSDSNGPYNSPLVVSGGISLGF